jgi:hypothetical protein
MESSIVETVTSTSLPAGLRLCRHHGTLSLVGETIDRLASSWRDRCQVDPAHHQKRVDRDGTEHYHMTIITKAEYKEIMARNDIGSTVGVEVHDDDSDSSAISILTANEISSILSSSCLSASILFAVGVSVYHSNSNVVTFLTTFCDFADRIRSKLGLEPKSFHITLGFAVSDVHDIDKSFQSIKQWEEEPTLYLQVCSVFENYRTTSGSSDSGVDVSKLSIILSRIVYYYLDILQADYPLTCGQQLAPRSLTTAAASKAPQAQQLQQAHKSNMEVLRNLCTFFGPYCHIQGLVIEISNWLLSRGLIVLALKAMAWCYMRCGPHFCSDVDCLLPVRVRQMDGKASATTATSREKLLLWNWNSLQYSSKGCESVIQSDDSEYSQPSSSSSSSSSLLSKKHTTVYSISHQSSAQSIFDKYSLPRNFSFIRCFLSTSQLSAQNNGSNESGTGAADGISWYHKIAGSAIPVHEEHMTALHGVGIGLIITLHEVPLPSGKILVCAAMCTCQFRCLLFYSVEMQLFESPLRHMESLRCTCMWSIELHLRLSNSGKSAE